MRAPSVLPCCSACDGGGRSECQRGMRCVVRAEGGPREPTEEAGRTFLSFAFSSPSSFEAFFDCFWSCFVVNCRRGTTRG